MYRQSTINMSLTHSTINNTFVPRTLHLLCVLFLMTACPIMLLAQFRDTSIPSPPAEHYTVPVPKMTPLTSPPHKLLTSVEVYPRRIYYGDVFFTTVTLYNPGTESVIIGRHEGPTGSGYNGLLLYFGNIVGKWPHDQESERMSSLTLWGKTFYVIEPKSELKLRFRCFWLPIHEVSTVEDMNHFLEDSWGAESVALQFSQAESISTSIKPIEAVTSKEIRKHVNYRDHDVVSTDYLIVAPRWNKDLILLREWYLEIPGLCYSGRYCDYISPRPDYVRGAPLSEAVFPEEALRKYNNGELSSGEYNEYYNQYMDEVGIDLEKSRQFVESLETRTPEVISRIERTNDLAAKIIERSKEPDSTFSQNMVEFIQLRGFLVDMRYAENEEAERKAFDALCEWVDTTADKELWIKLLNEVGLMSITNYDHFSIEKVDHYREEFVKRFQIEQAEQLE